MDDTRLVDLKTFSRILGISYNRARGWADRDKVETIQIGRHCTRYVPVTEVERYITLGFPADWSVAEPMAMERRPETAPSKAAKPAEAPGYWLVKGTVFADEWRNGQRTGRSYQRYVEERHPSATAAARRVSELEEEYDDAREVAISWREV